jgi:prepilin-type N-terminal cleavage/methylation domain-containing protein
MAALSSRFRLRLLHTVLQRRSTQGFTLTELLVAILISSLVVVGLLTLVVDLLQNERRDSARNETQREMQLTMDYIVQDMREAVYVYDGGRFVTTPPDASRTFSIPPIQNYLPNFSGQDGAVPVLAFWKPETIPYQSGGATIPFVQNYCANTFPNANDPRQQECTDLQVSRRTYSLVVYYQTTAASTAPWRGRSRLIRYVLRKYTNIANLTKDPGYVDPFYESSGIFRTWPLDSSGLNQQTTRPPSNSTATVLADFVDAPTNPAPDTPAGTCPSTEYVRTPDATNESFYSCVRPAPSLDNQDVVLFIRGSVWGKPGYSVSRANQVTGFLPALQTQVLLRGVLQKTGNNN